ncbi:MAG: putative peptidoglycan glycosyltransferase FtsW [Bacteroidota bacterium]|jgi:cell division protein FtsW|nr:putative peptidoglycan glycosyltransferase FtsW [Bacteroidota bacterium]
MKQRTGHIDLYVFLSVLALMLFSVGVVYSASVSISGARHDGDYNYLFRSHSIRVILGVAALFVGMFVDYHLYRHVSKILLLIALALLGYTLVGGTVVKGAQRWVSLGPLSFQPSEFAKFALMIHLAVLLDAKQKYIHEFRDGFVPLLIWIAAVVGLVFLQPNFSTGSIILGISFMLLFVGRVNLKHLFGVAVAGIPIVLVYAVSATYRWNRIMAHFSGDDGGASAGNYQVEQAIIGLGSGGLFGVGMGMSKQRELFLPESYTDFIFAIVGEEYGFVGAILVMALFAVVMIRGMKIAKRATDDLGRFLAVGITCTITVYAIVNAMVTTGLLPTTGLPMPLLSYGGTTIIFTAYALGILINISMYTRIRPRDIVLQPEAPAGPRVGELYQ